VVQPGFACRRSYSPISTRRSARKRDTGGAPPRSSRPRLVDEFLPKVEEWVENSKGKIRGDVAHYKLLALGFTGLELCRMDSQTR
jgi:hypothetical protein